jgi:hypothetical protein
MRTDLPLQKSHIVPRWSYRRATSTDGQRNPNPVWYSEGKVFQTSRQIVEQLLCSACEQAIGVDEGAVARLAGTVEAPSPLVSSMPRHFPKIGYLDEDTGWHFLRFAISIFWRAHLSHRPEFQDFLLPDDLASDFRLFLIDGSPLPSTHPVLMTVLDYSHGIHVGTLVSLPKASKTDGEYAASFVMGGMIFEIPRGPNERVRQAHLRLSLSHGTRPWVMVQPWDYRRGMRQIALDFSKGTLRKGRSRHRPR